jgi:hypothetical protein
MFVAQTTTSCIHIFEYLFVCSPSTFSEAKQFKNNDTGGVLQMAGYMSRGPPNGSVYVCNLPPGTDETMLAEYFGTIGLLKVWVLSGNIFATTTKFVKIPYNFQIQFHDKFVSSLLSYHTEGQEDWASKNLDI